MPEFSSSSERALSTCHPALRKLARFVIRDYDFTVLEGHRGKERQNRLVEEGRSTTEWPDSKHNEKPSLAIDVAPYPIDWEARGRFHVLAGRFFMAFYQLQREGVIDPAYSLRWGGDWDGDDVLDDQQFDDLPHFELIET